MTDEHGIAAKVTLKHYTTRTNLDAVRVETKDEIRRAIQAGAIDTSGMPSHLDYQVEALWRSADARARTETDRIRKLKSGLQGALDYGDDYDQMILVEKGRRTTLGRMTAEDRRLMAAESRDNRVDVVNADNEEQVAARADILILQKFADYEAYRKHLNARGATS